MLSDKNAPVNEDAVEFDDQVIELVAEFEDIEEYLEPYDWPEECDVWTWELGPDDEEPTASDLEAAMMLCEAIERRLEDMSPALLMTQQTRS